MRMMWSAWFAMNLDCFGQYREEMSAFLSALDTDGRSFGTPRPMPGIIKYKSWRGGVEG